MMSYFLSFSPPIRTEISCSISISYFLSPSSPFRPWTGTPENFLHILSRYFLSSSPFRHGRAFHVSSLSLSAQEFSSPFISSLSPCNENIFSSISTYVRKSFIFYQLEIFIHVFPCLNILCFSHLTFSQHSVSKKYAKFLPFYLSAVISGRRMTIWYYPSHGHPHFFSV